MLILTRFNRKKSYIHPKSENWYKNLVIQLVKQLGFDFTIEKIRFGKRYFDLNQKKLQKKLQLDEPF
jgi:hypothetical protein